MNYFKHEEFECKCGCGTNIISQKLVDRLNLARHIAGVPFVINSGCRCENHNAEIGGSKTSSHLLGLAVDIKVNNDADRFLILNGLIKAGFARIGVAKTFIHADIDRAKNQNRLWIY